MLGNAWLFITVVLVIAAILRQPRYWLWHHFLPDIRSCPSLVPLLLAERVEYKRWVSSGYFLARTSLLISLSPIKSFCLYPGCTSKRKSRKR